MPIQRTLERHLPQHAPLIGQMIRFGLTGGLLTLLVAGGYWIVADVFHVEPMLSMTLNYLVFTGLGYFLHSRWSFRGHGSRDRPGLRTARFFTVNTTGFLLNQFFVWLLVKHMGGPVWWSVIPIVLVTPLVTFSLNRRWVFG
ncbi:GtrA family protein [Sphingomonas parva]|uniref:GtrA family protein n=1 Tax=Sphingomonas parva TaxID=2555898 RepID=A0A4Y8ZVG1_9SPHN|nr:GtrA family protein [Sphingomonas parva]TFI60033.1 GtrA family protein [Sphingomonas parva]